MISEAEIRIIRSHIPRGTTLRPSGGPLSDASWFRFRDRHIADAIQGNIGILPTTPLDWKRAEAVKNEHFLRTELEERVRGEGGFVLQKRTVLVDTRYVPYPSDQPGKYTLSPEIYFRDIRVGSYGDVVKADAVRELPCPASPTVVKTVHRLIVGMLVDGANTTDVLNVYDKAAEITTGEMPHVTPQGFIRAFRKHSPRGGYLSYTALRFAHKYKLPLDR